MAATAKQYVYGKAPKRIELLGNKHKKPESAEHIIEFPGGAIELARTSDGNYWAHIIVNRKWASDDHDGRLAAFGEVVDARIGYEFPGAVLGVSDHRGVEQIAVLIRPTKAA